MASNNQASGTNYSSSQSGIPTPQPSSNDGLGASAAGSNGSTAPNQWQVSEQLLQYLAQPVAEDGSLYGRLVNQPPQGDLADRVVFYAARAQQKMDRF
ncbi:hypothetical protein C7999DRAFT_30657 [Corynascus novoguineensis]|uniref:Uncharacterized protein n=1 Tax=Corynascus novoguineensis TaxID=1126955 RepID=A0AAN7CW08_9PEZI|nr:hypothetical protein C7999DRAFT_30657 [Corynascus novoguineensis]